MRKAYIAIPVLVAGLAAGSCAIVDDIRDYGAGAAARLVLAECALSPGERQKNLDAINGWLIARGQATRAVALDCDGDGTPDF